MYKVTPTQTSSIPHLSLSPAANISQGSTQAWLPPAPWLSPWLLPSRPSLLASTVSAASYEALLQLLEISSTRAAVVSLQLVSATGGQGVGRKGLSSKCTAFSLG